MIAYMAWISLFEVGVEREGFAIGLTRVEAREHLGNSRLHFGSAYEHPLIQLGLISQDTSGRALVLKSRRRFVPALVGPSAQM